MTGRETEGLGVGNLGLVSREALGCGVGKLRQTSREAERGRGGKS